MPTTIPKFFTLTLLAALMAVNGCDWFRDSPENRARFFLETLVREPDNRARLDELAMPNDSGGPESVLDGLGVQLAVGYLRTRHLQGMDLDFAVTVAQRSAPSHRLVRVAVAAQPAGVRPEQNGRIRFEVALEMSEGQGWRVTRVSAE